MYILDLDTGCILTNSLFVLFIWKLHLKLQYCPSLFSSIFGSYPDFVLYFCVYLHVLYSQRSLCKILS